MCGVGVEQVSVHTGMVLAFCDPEFSSPSVREVGALAGLQCHVHAAERLQPLPVASI